MVYSVGVLKAVVLAADRALATGKKEMRRPEKRTRTAKVLPILRMEGM